jgi:hypothetical protein
MTTDKLKWKEREAMLQRLEEWEYDINYTTGKRISAMLDLFYACDDYTESHLLRDLRKLRNELTEKKKG